MKKLLITIMMLLPMMATAYDFEKDGIYYNITSIEEKTVEVTYSTDLNYQQNYIVIPAEVTWNNYVFSVKGIGTCAFDSGNYPNKVDTIIISKGIEYIGELAFQCQRLKKIQIPNTVKNIGSNAFSPGNERNITTDWYVEDYEWLCTIGHFFWYPYVKDIYVDNKKIDGDFIIPEGVPYISSFFLGCDWIKTLSIPSTVSSISGSFSRCTNLESVEIKEGVKNLYGQFNGCTNLKSVTLPNSLVSIEGYVFDNCPALIDIQSFITEPFPTDCFTNGQYLSATLKVPYGTKGKYQNTEGWKNFVNIEECLTPSETFYNLCFNVNYGGAVIYNESVITNTIAKTVIKSGEDLLLQIPPAESYRLTSLIVNDIDVTNMVTNGLYTIKNVSSDINIKVSFERYFDVGNLTKAVDFIMNSSASAEDVALYDLNNNKKLDIGDVILIVKFILNNNSNNAPNYIGRRAGEIADLAQYTAAQFEVKTTGDVDIRLVKSMEQTHQMMYQQKDANTYAVVVYSLTNQLMQPENGKIIETDNNSDILSIENVTVATPTGETAYYQTLSATTGIEQIDNENGTAVIYDLKGNCLYDGKALNKGIYIVNGKKAVVR